MNDVIRIRNIIREVFDDDAITISDETSRSSIKDWDSLAHVKLILALEEEFDVRFTTDEVSSLQSVGDLRMAIHKHTDQ